MNVSLSWPGKHLPPAPPPATLHLTETFEPLLPPLTINNYPLTINNSLLPVDNSPSTIPHSPLLCHGDNLPILASLLTAARRFRLIYADPPYNSGLDWTRKIRRRGPKQPDAAPLLGQQLQYGDAWEPAAYLQFIYARLPLLRDLLTDDGSLWLHCDHRHAHHLRCLLEEVFGPENYLNTITWRSQTARGAKVGAFYFPNSAHTILVFARNRAAPTCWDSPKKQLVLTAAEAAHEFMRDERGFFRTSDPGTYSFASLQRLNAEGRLYAPYGGEIVVDTAQQRVTCSNGGNIGVKYYLTDLGDDRYGVERAVDNLWDDIPGLGTTPSEDLGYPTQKTTALLTRILQASTAPGDWVLDPFCGSGTTLAVAQTLGRRWVGCDANRGAIQTTVRRLQAVIQQQLAAEPAPAVAEPAFAVYATVGGGPGARTIPQRQPAQGMLAGGTPMPPRKRRRSTCRLPGSASNRLEYGLLSRRWLCPTGHRTATIGVLLWTPSPSIQPMTVRCCAWRLPMRRSSGHNWCAAFTNCPHHLHRPPSPCVSPMCGGKSSC